MSLLELRDIHRRVRLPDGEMLTILDGVNLSIEAGEHVSIVGRSGSGKSTLLNLIGLLDSPTSGSYRLDDRELTKMSSGRRDRLRGRNFGFVFQQFNLLPGRTARENVETPLYYGGSREFFRRGGLAREVLEQVGLGDRLGNLPTQLSGGEQQRVSIARALVRRPRLILADEPTGALDVDTGVQVMELLSEVAQRTGAGLIVITHDPAVARRADTVYRLDAGVLASEVLV